VLLLVGAAAFRFLVLGRGSVRAAVLASGLNGALDTRTARLATMGAWLGLIAAACRFPLQVSELRDETEPLLPQLTALGLHTEWGLVWICQVALMLAAALVYAAAARGRRSWLAAAAVSALLIPTLSFSGHAIGSERLTALAVIADLLHVFAAGAWLGAMVMLLGSLTLIRGDVAASSPALAFTIVAAYSPMALGAASLILATGLVASWLHLGTVAALWQSRYGVTLLVKTTAVAAMAAIGARNWKREGPALAKSGDAAPIRRSVRTEVLLGLVVLLVTAALVVTAEPGAE
jgi:putative copper resistance protein D